jgi:hypothetical protein
MVLSGLVLLGAIISMFDGGSDSGSEPSESDRGAATSECRLPADGWLETLQSGFRREYKDAAITSSAYVETETAEGTAYYVAVEVEGVPGVAVFGTSDPPLQSDPGLIAGANDTAHELSISGIDIPEDSAAGTLLLDDGGTLAAQACL